MDEGEVLPPPNTPRVGDDTPPISCLITVKSPKFVAFPRVAIVTNDIKFVPALPPPRRPLVGLEKHPFIAEFASIKSPKSCELPSVDSVINSMVFTTLGVCPPAMRPLTGDDKPEAFLLSVVKSPKSAASPSVDIVT